MSNSYLVTKNQFADYIKQFDLKELFYELGWDEYKDFDEVVIGDQVFKIQGLAEKKGYAIVNCPPDQDGNIPLSATRRKIKTQYTKLHHENIIIYTDADRQKQIWQFTLKRTGMPDRVREITYEAGQDPELLYQKARGILFTLDEENNITLVDVLQRVNESFSANAEKVTKKFYTEFKKKHNSFMTFIDGIDDKLKDIDNKNKQWYCSVMLNRLMFCYFIQKQGYLDGNNNYLQDKLSEVRKSSGPDNFHSFYRDFLLELFHEGLGKDGNLRNNKVQFGKIPYLNGGMFDVHELEKLYDNIQIKDDAFEEIFDFFDQWNWHLDNRPDASGKDISPDVIGYIFEKYINDRAAMGAYYTKEDITEYISKNTILPYLIEETKRHYPKGFTGKGNMWEWLAGSNDTYIYDAVKKGVPKNANLFDDLPEDIKEGFRPDLQDKTVGEDGPHLWEIRKPWNRKVEDSEIALPTEIYRELIERRQRYAGVRQKIESGEIKDINDFITYNLNIRQFLEDYLGQTKDYEFIMHFYKSITGDKESKDRHPVSILDPTCGSGAFLFAAMNILEPLYEICLERMEQFVEEGDEGRYKYFEAVLNEVNSARHPNRDYFIYKSIILNNLYGVDIMHEAVEIAKLRLFLKMIAANNIDNNHPNYGLEPLPDIDFNIRSGNTLVGFTNLKEIENIINEKAAKEGRMVFPDELEVVDEIREAAEKVSMAYSRFKDGQIILTGQATRTDKRDLEEKLKELNDKLNSYLAQMYGIDRGKKQKEYDKWLESHQPFHWLAEFYGIVQGRGGFDVVIGNPPYVEYSAIKKKYSIIGYDTESCGNLYANVIERSFSIQSKNKHNGMIVQLPIVCTDRMKPLQKKIISNCSNAWFSNYDDRPGKLFDGLEHIRATIFILKYGDESSTIYSSNYYRWYSDNRSNLFNKLFYKGITDIVETGSFPKIGTEKSYNIKKKLKAFESFEKTNFRVKQLKCYFHNAPQYWIRTVDFIPYFWNQKDGKKISVQNKPIYADDDSDIHIICSFMNSSIFYWWFIVLSDCRHLNMREINNFPIALKQIEAQIKTLISKIHIRLMEDFQINANRKKANYKTTGKVEYDEFFPSKSKPIIDEIDTVLARHYGFSESELDFIINYDIKYRMGKEL